MFSNAEKFPVHEVVFERGIREARRVGVDLEYGARTHAMMLRETGGIDSPLMPFIVEENAFGVLEWKSFEMRTQQIEDFFSSLFSTFM